MVKIVNKENESCDEKIPIEKEKEHELTPPDPVISALEEKLLGKESEETKNAVQFSQKKSKNVVPSKSFDVAECSTLPILIHTLASQSLARKSQSLSSCIADVVIVDVGTSAPDQSSQSSEDADESRNSSGSSKSCEEESESKDHSVAVPRCPSPFKFEVTLQAPRNSLDISTVDLQTAPESVELLKEEPKLTSLPVIEPEIECLLGDSGFSENVNVSLVDEEKRDPWNNGIFEESKANLEIPSETISKKPELSSFSDESRTLSPSTSVIVRVSEVTPAVEILQPATSSMNLVKYDPGCSRNEIVHQNSISSEIKNESTLKLNEKSQPVDSQPLPLINVESEFEKELPMEVDENSHPSAILQNLSSPLASFRSVAENLQESRSNDDRVFEDDDIIINVKKVVDGDSARKRKLILEDDDEDDEDDDDDDEDDSSDDDDEDEVEPSSRTLRSHVAHVRTRSGKILESKLVKSGKKKAKRRARRIKEFEELAIETRKAREAEEARIARLNERQAWLLKKRSDQAPGEAVVEAEQRVVFEEIDDDVLEVDPEIASKLKPHQVEACQFMWTSCCESIDRLTDPHQMGSGCIIAHCMGLGKTLSSIAFVHAMLYQGHLTGVKRVLIVAPLNTVLNWMAEINRWMPESRSVDVYELSEIKDMKERALEIEDWFKFGGILVLGYDLFRLLVQAKVRNSKSKLNIFRRALLNPGPDIIICDEGHILKSEKSVISKVLNEVRTRRRIILTGTPLQNNLFEYHCMVSFIKPNFLGTRLEFANMFVNPIKAGETLDADDFSVRLMKKRTSVLYRLLASVVHRRGYEHLAYVLPQKHEYVLLCLLTPIQCQLYDKYLREVVGLEANVTNISEEAAHSIQKRLFDDYHILNYICAHPALLFDSHEREIEREWKAQFKRDMEASTSEEDQRAAETLKGATSCDPIDVDKLDEREADSDSETSFSNAESSEDNGRSSVVGRRPMTRNMARLADINPTVAESSTSSDDEPPWFADIIDKNIANVSEASTKFVVMLHLLRSFERIGDKVLIFSQSILLLNLFEKALAREASLRRQHLKDPAFAGLMTTFQKNVDYFRIDGATSAQVRRDVITKFNNVSDQRARVFLISTKAGGVGVNLIGANRVILVDTAWNPAIDVQAIFRAYRFGQTKPVGVYRLVAAGCMEERIYDRQVNKQSLAQRVVDEQQIARHFSTRDLVALYRFDPSKSKTRDSRNERMTRRFPLPKDSVFAELLKELPHVISSYHEQDSLLEHQIDEEMNENDRVAAWVEYEYAQKGVRVDSSNPVASHREISSYLRRSQALETQAADVNALHDMLKKFGDIRPAVKQYVNLNLPIYERAAAEAEARKRAYYYPTAAKQQKATRDFYEFNE